MFPPKNSSSGRSYIQKLKNQYKLFLRHLRNITTYVLQLSCSFW